MSNTIDYNEHYFPVAQATPGKAIYGTVLTCKGCGLQVILTRRDDYHPHRWWERLGWGKIAVFTGRNMERGKSMKGELFCPACHPKAHREAVGEGMP